MNLSAIGHFERCQNRTDEIGVQRLGLDRAQAPFLIPDPPHLYLCWTCRISTQIFKP
ncbi:MAG: hypothetical protein ACI9S8_003030 [Chlamydiales bacterium]|jgi:hypothetical protein